jgi:hypothetical protein
MVAIQINPRESCMRPVTMEVGWPSTGVKVRGCDWEYAVERRKEKGERRKERYIKILLIKDGLR